MSSFSDPSSHRGHAPFFSPARERRRNSAAFPPRKKSSAWNRAGSFPPLHGKASSPPRTRSRSIPFSWKVIFSLLQPEQVSSRRPEGCILFFLLYPLQSYHTIFPAVDVTGQTSPRRPSQAPSAFLRSRPSSLPPLDSKRPPSFPGKSTTTSASLHPRDSVRYMLPPSSPFRVGVAASLLSFLF